MEMEKESCVNAEELGVMNFQIQYFPRQSKAKIEELASRNGLKVKELMILISNHVDEIEKIFKKRKYFPTRH